MTTVFLEPIDASPEACSGYGIVIQDKSVDRRIPIPFYDHVEEGQNLPFAYSGKATLRTARIHPANREVFWLERHRKLTQLFLGVGGNEFILVLGRPTESQVPDLESIAAFRFAAGSGILIHQSVWHDFPMAVDKPVTVLTANSEEIVLALTQMEGPQEMDQNDVLKIDVKRRLGATVTVKI
ncbi:MAG: ureidoglycolate lyase [Pseudomonadota bacterium]